jgi:hypothetical protein
MQTSVSATASSWDSFKDALYEVLEATKPKTVFEYGPGTSTSIMAIYPSVELIDSVEHNVAWYQKYRWQMPDNVKIVYQPNMELYPETPGRVDKYDLIFVDGREREKCLYVAKARLNPDGVVILHDAERPNYQEMMRTYKFMFLRDDGHTAILTDSHNAALRVQGAMND